MSARPSWRVRWPHGPDVVGEDEVGEEHQAATDRAPQPEGHHGVYRLDEGRVGYPAKPLHGAADHEGATVEGEPDDGSHHTSGQQAEPARRRVEPHGTLQQVPSDDVVDQHLARRRPEHAGEAMHPGQWQKLALVPEVDLTMLPQMNTPATSIPDNETGLLMILHGSPRPEANAPALRIAEKLANNYGRVIVGYLECNQPDVPTAIQRFAAANIKRIIVVPYFLHPGRHLVIDIPGHLLESMKIFPTTEILLSYAVGLSPQVTEVLAARAKQAR